MLRKTSYLAILLVVSGGILSACASSASDASRAEQSRITAQELEAVRANNLYQAVERLRPRWLVVRGGRSFERETVIVVYQNQSRLGGPDVLRSMSIGSARWLQYLDGPTASASLPGISRGQHIQGAIVIHTRGDGG
jgi:hypothetical protein